MYVGHIAAYRRTRSHGRLAWSEGRRLSGAGLRTSDEPGELSQWLSHDDSTINIIIRIIIIIIIIITHADDSSVRKAFSSICDSVCVCPHDKTKTAETKITKLGTGIVHHDTSPTN